MTMGIEDIMREVDTLPEAERRRIVRVLEEEVRKARRTPPAATGRWARFAERMHREAPMAGKSEEFLREARRFRGHLDMRIKPAGE